MENSENLSIKDKLKKPKLSEEPSIPSFLQKTYEILEDPKCNDIISWSDDGHALVIKDAKQFSEKILPFRFKHGNISSFIRQLNMYDFKKIKNKKFEFMFAHDMFQRGRRDLLRDIRRKNSDISLVLNKNHINVDDVSERDPATLYQENIVLKRVQKEITEKIKNLENRLNELSKQNEVLRSSLQQTQQQNTQQFTKSENNQPSFEPYGQKVPQLIQIPFPGHIIQPQWNTIANAQQGHQQTIQFQGAFPMSNVNFDQTSVFAQGVSQKFMPQPNQVSFVVMPSMNLLDQSKQQVGMIQNGSTHLIQNSTMMIPHMSLFETKEQSNLIVKSEENPQMYLQNDQNKIYAQDSANQAKLKGTLSGKPDNTNDNNKNESFVSSNINQKLVEGMNSKMGFRPALQAKSVTN